MLPDQWFTCYNQLMSKLQAYLQQKPALTAAVTGYIQKDDKILLGVRKKVSYGLGEQLIAGIGGKLEQGETNEKALRREVKEEIGVTVTSYEYRGQTTFLFPHKPKWNQKVAEFVISSWSGEPTETEEIKPLWFNKNALPKDRMWPDNLLTIPLMLAGKTINGVFLYNEDGTIEEYILEEVT